MRRLVIALSALLCSILTAAPTDQNQLDSSEALFTVMAAINAAGFDMGLAGAPPLRKQVREAVAAKNPPVLAELKEAYAAASERRDPAAVLTEFLSLGLSIKNPPDFEWRVREAEVPPDAAKLDPFRRLLPRFYREAGISDLWKRSQRAVEQELERYQEPVVQTVTEVNGYLRNPGFGYLGRHFQVYFDMLTPPNVVQTRSYGDDYFVVISPALEPRIQEIRHAYLYFLMDPLGTKYGMELKEKSSLADFAAAAPALGANFKEDFTLLAVACLVKAIESRMTHNPSLVEQDLREGFILTPYFAEQLALYEKQPESMRLYFPKMVAGINVRRESKRLAAVHFAEAPAVRAAKPLAQPQPAALSPSGRSLEAAEDSYSKKDVGRAEALYQKALDQTGEPAEHARAFYGLARIAVMQSHPESAEQLFKKSIEASPDQETLGWAHYYLGQLALHQNPPDTTEAAHRFQQTLAVEGANRKSRELAQKALDELKKP